jgi:hypothetical protein
MEPEGSLPCHKGPPLVPILRPKWLEMHTFLKTNDYVENKNENI